ncbi:MAG: hypothetical protein L3J89_02435 [Gammaproteobacteria bacterium]|nr:hypothetical protein [Gammaproteobacteria bacterium]
MKRWNIWSVKSGFVSVMLAGGMVFSAGKANANFFDALNDSLRSVSTEVEQAKDGLLSKAQLKLNESSKQVDNTEAKLAEERKKIDAIKADGKAVVADVESTSQDIEGLAASVAGE